MRTTRPAGERKPHDEPAQYATAVPQEPHPLVTPVDTSVEAVVDNVRTKLVEVTLQKIMFPAAVAPVENACLLTTKFVVVLEATVITPPQPVPATVMTLGMLTRSTVSATQKSKLKHFVALPAIEKYAPETMPCPGLTDTVNPDAVALIEIG